MILCGDTVLVTALYDWRINHIIQLRWLSQRKCLDEGLWKWFNSALQTAGLSNISGPLIGSHLVYTPVAQRRSSTWALFLDETRDLCWLGETLIIFEQSMLLAIKCLPKLSKQSIKAGWPPLIVCIGLQLTAAFIMTRRSADLSRVLTVVAFQKVPGSIVMDTSGIRL